MSKFTDQLRTIGISNPHDLTRDGHPYVWYRAGESRMCVVPAWMVTLRGKRIDGPWHDYGNKSFTCGYFDTRAEALQKALAFAAQYCPDSEMVKGPWRNTWVVKADLDAAKAAIREAKKS